MNAVIYARYSSHNQTEASIEGQLKYCYDYAKQNGINVVGEYIDREKSGTSADKRENFLRMIKDSAKGHFQGLLVYQLDRFSRNRYDSATYKARLKKNGVKVISVRENISDDASGVLMEAVLEGMAEYYSRELSQKVMRGQAISASKLQVANGGCPYGYKIENKKLIINEDTAPYAKKIFEMYASGSSMQEICQYLNGLGVKTSKGNDFTISSISQILPNKKYCGYFIFKDMEVKDGIPAIISEEIFEEVKARLSKNKHAPASAKAIDEEYILTTKLFCGHCKNAMVGDSGTSHTGKRHHYYTCQTVKRLKKCAKKTVRKKYIEDLVINECHNLLNDENINMIANEVINICEQEKDNSNYLRLEKAYKANEKQKDNLINSLANTNNDSIVKKIYEKLEELDKQGIEIKKEMIKEEKLQNTLTREMILFFLNDLKNGNINDIRYRKLLVTVFVNKIYLYDDKITIIFNTQSQNVNVDISLIEGLSGSDMELRAEPSRVLI